MPKTTVGSNGKRFCTKSKEHDMNLNKEALPPFEQMAAFSQHIHVFEKYLEENKLKIIWLASYPRSGNRFLETLLFLYLQHNDKGFENYWRIKFDIHTLGYSRFDNVSVYRVSGENIIFCKTHFPFNARHPFYTYTYGVIHLYRRPFDIAVSDFIMSEYHSISHDEKLVNAFLTNYFAYFTNFYLSPTSSLYGYSSWPEHYFSWKKFSLYSDVCSFHTDFDSLQHDPKAFMRLLSTFDFPIDAARIDDVYSKATRENAERFQKEMLAQGSENGGFFDYAGKPMIHITPQEVKNNIRKKAMVHEKTLDELYKKWTSII